MVVALSSGSAGELTLSSPVLVPANGTATIATRGDDMESFRRLAQPSPKSIHIARNLARAGQPFISIIVLPLIGKKH